MTTPGSRYKKRRILNTLAALDELGPGAIIVDHDGEPAICCPDGWRSIDTTLASNVVGDPAALLPAYELTNGSDLDLDRLVAA